MIPQDNKPQALQATDFTPLQQQRRQRKLPLAPAPLALAVVVLLSVAIMIYLLLARSVIFRLQPADASISTSGLSFHIGDNYLFLPGEHRVQVTANGYHPLEQAITVSDQSSQQIAIELQPLPGHLQVASALSDIQLSIDGQPAVSVPGLVENISQGSHQLLFSKHRYFPLTQLLDIVGLDTTQTLSVELKPAWGQLQISSQPAGATVLVDEREVGQTPLQTEVLETGSELTLQLEGYKRWQQTVTVSAGSTGQYPTIPLEVADGLVTINSSPSAASVTINNQFKGVTPLQVALSPLQSHQLTLFKEGYFKTRQQLDVEPEQQLSLQLELKPNLADIVVSLSPKDAELLVDGRSVGAGKRTLSLTATEHRIDIRREGYASQTTTVVPRPGHQQALDIKLLTLEQAYWATRPDAIRSELAGSLKLIRPDGASFTMGAPRREPGRRANEVERNVSLQRPFYIGSHEITNEQFRRWKAEHSSTAIKSQTLDMEQQPVVKVSWQDAALFCNWLSRQEGLPPFYQLKDNLVSGFNWQAHGYRLPTEAEWAYVAKIDSAGNSVMFPWGTDSYPPTEIVENYADLSAAKFLSFTLSNYNDKYPVSAAVGSFKANRHGLFDIGGNVAEWANDYYDVRVHRGESMLDPQGPESGTRYVLRGASWALASRTELRLSYREAGEEGRLDVGFRVARYVDKPGGGL
jgi:formylglycine-generating enzyme required for sulfatase activity